MQHLLNSPESKPVRKYSNIRTLGSLYQFLSSDGAITSLPPHYFSSPLPFPLPFPNAPSSLILFMVRGRIHRELLKEAFNRWLSSQEEKEKMTLEATRDLLRALLLPRNHFNLSLVEKVCQAFHRDEPEISNLLQAVTRVHRYPDILSRFGSLVCRDYSCFAVTPLELACYAGMEEAVRRLLEVGADPEDYVLYPPLALAGGTLPIIKELCHAGADIKAKGFFSSLSPGAREFIRPICYSVMAGEIEEIENLRAMGGSLTKSLTTAVLADKEDVFDHLICLGAKMKIQEFSCLLYKNRKQFSSLDWFFSKKLQVIGVQNLVPLLHPRIWSYAPAENLLHVKRYAEPSRKRASRKLTLFLVESHYKPGGPGCLVARDNFNSTLKNREKEDGV